MPNVLDTNHPVDGRANKHAILLSILGFFWLLRPSEYLDTHHAGRTEAFRLCDVTFHIHDRQIPATEFSLNDETEILAITRATLTFSDQKNAVRGEQISHASTDDPFFCPCKALARLCRHIRAHSTDPHARLYSYWDGLGNPRTATTALITNALRHAARDLVSTTGIDPNLLSACSLRPGGATALLCANVDADVIQLLGRWKSDAMLRYLRVAAHANYTNYAQHMLRAGDFTFAPRTFADPLGLPLPAQAPPPILAALSRAELYHT
jgi:hypothetical protein